MFNLNNPEIRKKILNSKDPDIRKIFDMIEKCLSSVSFIKLRNRCEMHPEGVQFMKKLMIKIRELTKDMDPEVQAKLISKKNIPYISLMLNVNDFNNKSLFNFNCGYPMYESGGDAIAGTNEQLLVIYGMPACIVFGLYVIFWCDP